MRPQSLDDLVGQEHLVGEGGAIRKMLKTGHLTSMIFWGPPGTGKTTLAEIIANEGSREFYRLSAISAGVKDVREIIEQAKKAICMRRNLQFYSLTKSIGSIKVSKILCWRR